MAAISMLASVSFRHFSISLSITRKHVEHRVQITIIGNFVLYSANWLVGIFGKKNGKPELKLCVPLFKEVSLCSESKKESKMKKFEKPVTFAVVNNIG